jgi:hypothetical protein
MDPGVFIRAKIVEFFLTGVEGDSVAEWFQLADPATANYLGTMTAEGITEQVIKLDPIMKQMYGHPGLPKFVDEFLSYWKPDEEGAPEKDAVPVH